MPAFCAGGGCPGPPPLVPLGRGAAPLALHHVGPSTDLRLSIATPPPPPTTEDLPAGSCPRPSAPTVLLAKPDVFPGQPPPYKSVRARLSTWRAIGASRWVLSTLSTGLTLPWLSPPPPYRARPIRQPPDETRWASTEIARWVRRGFVRQAKASEARRAPWNAATFVADAARKPRLVVDLSEINSYLADRPFRYESLASFVAQLEAGDHMVS